MRCRKTGPVRKRLLWGEYVVSFLVSQDCGPEITLPYLSRRVWHFGQVVPPQSICGVLSGQRMMGCLVPHTGQYTRLRLMPHFDLLLLNIAIKATIVPKPTAIPTAYIITCIINLSRINFSLSEDKIFLPICIYCIKPVNIQLPSYIFLFKLSQISLPLHPQIQYRWH